MTTAKLKEMMAELIQSQKETDTKFKETDRQLKELGKQIGGLGNKFGSFTEGFAGESVRKILREKFGMELITGRTLIQKNGKEEEYDHVAYTNGSKNKGMIVEIKSHLDERTLKQMKRKMDGLFSFLPEHKDKSFEGMVCYIEGSKDVRDAVLKEGWHLVHVTEDLFKLEDPKGFKPKIYKAK